MQHSWQGKTLNEHWAFCILNSEYLLPESIQSNHKSAGYIVEAYVLQKH